MDANNNQEIAKNVAKMLLDIEAIKLRPQEPFTWSSGWNSPIYCDNRMSLSYPEIRTYIKKALAEAIKTNFPDAECIAGVATAGIPQGALVAEELGLPFNYVRSKPKGHGMGNMIEGLLKPGQKVVLIEDLISTGGSSLKAADALKEAGAEVLGLAAIFTYGFALADENFENAKVPFVCLSDYEEMLKVAKDMDYIKESDVEALQEWRKDPATWNK
ncbi:orotate phosphoribosyltransferase [Aureibacter tunicatorum]|uniref:Orotate phosphoribosyltransferase n=1 Tax=Aureibacter tunicatorum TaxID=866807 RepID=A0AAE4BRW6_9BACT|nr:orotate phosphoribosyltransferase [Aureibacter tunicatorum]MDR6238285.1 orotate phosphoribosyltransferase [Aureibacter tunicatorum]BDD03318.1 orotate phosphoribosyltransferase [Aureibacter tunicatorum]